MTGDCGDGFESAIAAAKIEKVVGIERELRLHATLKVNAHQAIGLRIRQGSQQHALNHTENRAIGADAEASVSTTTAVKPGVRHSERMA